MKFDEFCMDLAIKKAWEYQILTYPNPAVGCVICDEFGKILSISAHQKSGTSHAELNAVKSALLAFYPKLKSMNNANEIYEFILKNHNNFFKNKAAFVTLEPCSHQGKTPSCAKLLTKLGFKKVVIGSVETTLKAKGGAEILQNANIDVKMGVLKHRCDELIEPFLKWQSGNFSFFKLATSLNGVISGGTISGEKSRILVHQIRSILPLLAIGGNSVRTDRPTLDARLVSKNAPDVFIYSHLKEFDKEIPLFGVKNRKIYIDDDINFIRKYPLCMIEGGANFIANLPEFVEHFLIFFAPNFLNRTNFIANLSLKLLFLGKIGDEFYGWFKRC